MITKEEQRTELKKQARPGVFIIGAVLAVMFIVLAGYFIGTYGIGAGPGNDGIAAVDSGLEPAAGVPSPPGE